MSETIKHIKKFNIGDRVTSTNTIFLDRGFRGVSGTIKSIVKDNFDSWQYLIQLDDGRELQCDDWHLEQPELDDNQQIVLDWLEAYADKDSGDYPMQTIFYMWDCVRSGTLGIEELAALRKLTRAEQFEVLSVFAIQALDQEGNRNGIN